MNEIKFVKMHGAGNDFIMVDDRELTFPSFDYRRVAAMCTRRIGIGSEGLILVQPSDKVDFKMRFFNPDGSEAELCGNGSRCVAAFARSIGAAKADKMAFETAAGIISAEVLPGNQVKLEMPEPHDFRDDFCIAGVPHKIKVVEDLVHTDVEGIGRAIRLSRDFAPEGTNVDFVIYRQPNKVLMRTYERGVEAESGACGTGALAAATIGVRDYGLEYPVVVKTMKGYELVVDGNTLTGPYAFVFSGTINFDSLDSTGE